MSKPEEAIVIGARHDVYMSKVGKKSKETRGFLHFHPSSFGDCLRKVALQYYGELDPWYKVEEEIDPRKERIFSAGHAFHNRMQKEFSDMGIIRGYWKSKITGKVYGKDQKLGIFRPKTLEEVGEERHDGDERSVADIFEYEEIRVKDKEHNFQGHCDGVVDLFDGDPEHMYVVDFKTINTDKFKMTTEPDSKYVTQITIYMEILGIDQGVIFYEEKSRHERKEFLVRKDKELVKDIFDNAKTLMDLIEKRKLPKIPHNYKPDKYPCKWCEYLTKCQELANKKKDK